MPGFFLITPVLFPRKSLRYMLQIDYSLIPLSDEDNSQIEKDVAKRLAAGEMPKLNRSHAGRLVVLNPDPVQTTHHVPDSLRNYLRRVMLHVTEGPIKRPAEKIFKDLVESEEPLQILVIEQKNPFPHFGEVLNFLPALKKRFPNLGVFLSGDLPDCLSRFKEIMETEGLLAQLTYPDARGTIDIDDPAEFSQVITEEQKPVELKIPFFSQIRLALEDENRPVVYNLDTLKRLQTRYGYGEVKEFLLEGGQKERVVIVDIPIRAIRDFQFRQDRGLDFYGIVKEGYQILSKNFGKNDLELKWIPFKSVEGILKRGPSGVTEQVDVSQVKVMRVNCFNGNVSFISRNVSDQLSLDDMQSVGFKKRGSKGGSALVFDRVVLPSKSYSNDDPMQDKVKDFFLGRFFRGDAEKNRKLEIYTSGLKVGAVGPLAGQTLKLLRRFGLEGLIDPSSFHYLCDLPQQLLSYHDTPVRFEAHFKMLMQGLREIQTGSGHIRIGDYMHQMPTTCAWIDSKRISFTKALPDDYDKIYTELMGLMQFIGHEFQRNFDIRAEDLPFFNKIKTIQQTALLARWLADFKRGAYGPPLPVSEFPDVVFFGTLEDKKENDEKYYFPALACQELFSSSENQKLFSKIDFGFSVFLEEQIALADDVYRKEGKISLPLKKFDHQFEHLGTEAHRELEGLKSDLINMDQVDSEAYKRLFEAEQIAYKERFEEVKQDKEKVAAQHREAEGSFWTVLSGLMHHIGPIKDPEKAWLTDEVPDAGMFDRTFLAAFSQVEVEKKKALEKAYEEVIREILKELDEFYEIVDLLSTAYKNHQVWQKARGALVLKAQISQTTAKAKERFDSMGGMTPEGRAGHAKKVNAQKLDLDPQSERLEKRLAAQQRIGDQAIKSIRETMNRLLGGFSELTSSANEEDPGKRREILENNLKRMVEISQTVRDMVDRITGNMAHFESFFSRQQKMKGVRYSLDVDLAMLKALEAGTDMALPPEPAVEAGETGEELETLNAVHQENREKIEKFKAGLGRLAARVEPQVHHLDGLYKEYYLFYEGMENLGRESAKKTRMRESFHNLEERHKIMEVEMADLPARVREKALPARKGLLEKVFIPEGERKVVYFHRARSFIQDFARLSFDEVKALYLDRAVFRRFSSDQFRRGVFVAMDTQNPKAKRLRNLLPSLNLLSRTLYFNYNKQHPEKAPEVTWKLLANQDMFALKDFVENLASQESHAPYDFVVLPPTLSLAEAVEIMVKKDQFNLGVPRLVLIYLSKYASTEISENENLRKNYFKALKHNIIVNVDEFILVDNPQTIALRMLHETLGSTFDTDFVEELPENEEEQVIKL